MNPSKVNINFLWPLLVFVLFICQTVKARGYHPPKYDDNRQNRIKLNLGLHVPPIIVKMPRIEMPQLVIGANLIKNPKARPLVLNMPPPPKISFGDSKYDSGGYYGGSYQYAAAGSQQVENVKTIPNEYSFDTKAYGSEIRQNIHPPYSIAAPSPSPVPVPMVPQSVALYSPPPLHYHPPNPNIVPPPLPPYSQQSMSYPPSPYYYHEKSPMMPPHMMAPPPPAVTSQAQPISSPTNPIQSYPIQQHYYPYQYSSMESMPQQIVYQAQPPSTERNRHPHYPHYTHSFSGVEGTPPSIVHTIPPSSTSHHHYHHHHQYKMPQQKFPFHLIKNPGSEDHKLRLKPNDELYDSEQVYAASDNDLVTEDYAKEYNAAPRISMPKYHQRN